MRIFLLLLVLLVRGHAVTPLPTDRVLLIGRFAKGPVEQPVAVNAASFAAWFASINPTAWPAEMQARQFFRNGGTQLEVVRIDPSLPLSDALSGRFVPPALRGCGWTLPFSDLGLLLIPEITHLPSAPRNALLTRLRELADTRHFTLLLDPPGSVDTTTKLLTWAAGLPQDLDFAMALYPHVLANPGNGSPIAIGASGSVAPVILRKDAAVGVWKSAAGTDASLQVDGLFPTVPSGDTTTINAANICLIRHFTSSGTLLWGWRTRDTLDPENTYPSINRLRRWITHSLRRGLAAQASGQASNSSLWTSLQSQSNEFLAKLYRDGAFAGNTPSDAYFVRCDATTTTVNDVSQHRANLLLGIAPLRAAEFQIVAITYSTLQPSRPLPESHLLLALHPGGGWRVFHTSAPGFSHRIQDSGTLAPGSWIDRSNLPGDGGWREFSGTSALTPRFFRLQTN